MPFYFAHRSKYLMCKVAICLGGNKLFPQKINIVRKLVKMTTVLRVFHGNGVFLVILSVVFLQNASTLHRTLRHYEILRSEDCRHKIVKRGIKHSSHPYNVIKEVEFKALGKHFRLILHPHREVLHSNFKAYTVDGDGNETVVHLDHDNYYTGRVFGEMESSVRAHIDDGLMTMSIHLPDETYHVEPSWRHLPLEAGKTMVAYRTSDMKLNWNKNNNGLSGAPMTCGYVKEGLDLEIDEDEDIDRHSHHSQTLLLQKDDEDDSAHKRKKRQADQYEYTPTKTRCPLLLVADYRFFQEMGGGNTKTTINYLISLIDRVHKIYNDTVWQDRTDQEGFKGMGFVIKKIVVHSEPTRLRGGEAHYNMIREKWDVRNLLESILKMGTLCI
ncbi:PREDICTED: ADAM 17-like protease isoform X3 [Rhagoletis zephyria]|uniref:ADAM 17-like protease isoform X3 n=1 Tax=Rhagoletis zephyria TaxID=28612 RepID=UPI000811A171|nr:PREDICTED: ADAM 17-like protease isoform X3 [Rhagoletis zephyria]